MSDNYNFPESISVLLNKHVGQCKNLALILDKYPPAHVPGNSQGKSEWLKRLEPNGHIDTTLTQSAYNRWRDMMSAMRVTLFNAILDWRMVIGLGGETVLETDITLHHLYGIPFIPGSALKGLARAFAAGEDKEYYIPVNRPKDERKPSLKEETDHPDVQRIFGTQKEAGTVLFFDAMPLDGKATFVLDIMNPHYPDYYDKKQPPTNDQAPRPVTFLTVTSTTFTFALVPRDASNEQHVKDVEQVKGWLQEALQKYGIGGKTSAGYGYFKVGDDEPKHNPKNEQRLEAAPAATQLSPPLLERKPVELPSFQVNQEIMGVVTTEAQHNSPLQRLPMESSSVLLTYRDSRNRDYSLDDVVILVSTTEYSETQNWKAKEQRKCQITQIEQRNNCTILICKPARSKFADKKKR